jgi:predicted nucleotidyltransferase
MKPATQSFLRYPLDRVLDSPANVRVLRALARHGGEMATGMLMDRTALTRVSVLAALRRLADSRLIEVIGSDRQRLSRFNDKDPLAAAVKYLFAAESERYARAIDQIREAAENLGAKAVWIYGSVARSQDRSDSDIDIAVAVQNTADGDIPEAIREKLRQLEIVRCSVVVVDGPLLTRLERERDPWWVALKRDAVTVMGAAPENYLGWMKRQEAKQNDANQKRKKSRS